MNRFQVLQKLERTGIRETTLKSMEDYLTNSKQRVRINERLSNELSVKFGVPQGNIIGTTLFMECTLINGRINIEILSHYTGMN